MTGGGFKNVMFPSEMIQLWLKIVTKKTNNKSFHQQKTNNVQFDSFSLLPLFCGMFQNLHSAALCAPRSNNKSAKRSNAWLDRDACELVAVAGKLIPVCPTLPEPNSSHMPGSPNIAPENRPSQKEISSSNHPFSGAMLVSRSVATTRLESLAD